MRPEEKAMNSKTFPVKIAGLAVCAAMFAAAGAAVAAAQYGPPPGDGYAQYYHEQGRPMVGARMGWQAGFAQGRSDRLHGHSFRPTHTDQFKNVPESPEGYPRDRFKHEYRDAFIRGYQRGYGA
jgi:hypothetical protein